MTSARATLRHPPAVLRFLLVAAIGLALDLWTKHLAFAKLKDGPYEFIPGWLHFEITVNRGAVFGIGFPPRAWKRKVRSKNGDFIFSLNWLPLGGFVKLKGEHDADTEKGTFGAASTWVKTKIMAAGVYQQPCYGGVYILRNGNELHPCRVPPSRDRRRRHALANSSHVVGYDLSRVAHLFG